MLAESEVSQLSNWALPSAFLGLLNLPPDQVIDQLIPTRSKSPSIHSSEVPGTSFHPFIEALKNIPDILTEKGALAHKTTDSPLVDLFFDLAPGIASDQLYKLLEAAWTEDSLATLKIIFHSRSIHEGKGFKDGFYRAMAWLWDEHPRTFIENLHLIVDHTCPPSISEKQESKKRQKREKQQLEKGHVLELDDEGGIDLGGEIPSQYSSRPHGTFNDLLDLLILHINGQLSTSFSGKLTAVNETLAPNISADLFKQSRIQGRTTSKRDRQGFLKIIVEAKKREKKDVDDFQAKLWKAPTLSDKHQLLSSRLQDALTNDKKFQALYLTVLRIFHGYLEEDLKLLFKYNEQNCLGSDHGAVALPHISNMSFAAKWAPTPGKSADKQLHIATALAKLFYPGDDVIWARQKLQKEILTPLRKALAIPEVAMSNQSWKFDYNRVPSRSMAHNAEAFMAHDQQGFAAYLDRVSQGLATVSGASLMPHELLYNAIRGKSPVAKRLADLQWATLVDSIRSSSSDGISNCIAIADVSGSMGSLNHGSPQNPPPVLPCIALTLLLSELASPPWQGRFFTFSTEPACEYIDPNLPLAERASQLSKAHWGMSTEFYKTYELILATAKKNELAPEHMVKKLFVFSDMQFDAAGEGKYGETEHETMKRRFEEAGYPLPEMVYWNLASRAEGTPKPTKSDVEGVTLFSGFSGALMKFFLGDGVEDDALERQFADIGIGKEGESSVSEKERKKPNPLEQVHRAISGQPFAGLKVVD
ncbi:hypothetical protein C351_02670 [Cryptococcus neoformans c8]|nr:hypothetical protein C353_02948 [Cryptococcus neoformans var. grubii AD1-83a]OXG60674.1 hypothetical protein C354_02885 [Cryptococcus neoformans var. grubii MW-RSA1955]OXG64161.1 hypothetical protein C351_02670 [Cryptococcus neoformans var. grubii c8]OXG65559.1 hypothetical protein C352_02895 [Cryptococcus neoformans var. grubii CHC193]OXH11972.1 hypothetical protein C369_02921 [Cryptococcus neoformans var. grubii A5-35-17]OXH13144.1 hypothetical protein C370_02940 [Cryptococcus neoformans 